MPMKDTQNCIKTSWNALILLRIRPRINHFPLLITSKVFCKQCIQTSLGRFSRSLAHVKLQKLCTKSSSFETGQIPSLSSQQTPFGKHNYLKAFFFLSVTKKCVSFTFLGLSEYNVVRILRNLTEIWEIIKLCQHIIFCGNVQKWVCKRKTSLQKHV